jgi:cytochrome c oxidase subunit 3
LAESHTASQYGLAHHFDDLEQQHEAGTLGMWAFLVTEIMFFGGLFLAYVIYRMYYATEFAVGSSHLNWKYGAFNTVVLICSSLTMALAVFNSQVGNRRLLILFLVLTIVLGLVFLGVKSIEYHEKFVDHHIPGFGFVWQAPTGEPLPGNPQYVQLFYFLYFAMTGVHALHMIIGIGIMVVLIFMARRGRFTPEHHSPVEISGLYWHFVDIVWIFLFPLLYLLGAHLEH